MIRVAVFSMPILPLFIFAAVGGTSLGCESNKEPGPAPSAQGEPLPSNLPGMGRPPQGSAANPHAVDPHSANPHQGTAADPIAELPQAAIEWDAPAGWKQGPPRAMRLATYLIEGKGGAGEVAVFYFGPGQGGTVDANISRWVAQFQDLPAGAEKRSEKEVNGLKHFSVVVENGNFVSGMPGAPAGTQANWGMMATIVQSTSGQYFFKLTGPAETVKEQAAAFVKMVESARDKK